MNRVSPIEERATAEMIVRVSLAVLARCGRFERAVGADARVLQADVADYTLHYVTPFSRLVAAPAGYGLEVALARRGSVFAAWWDPFRITVFVRGPWTNAFVPGSFRSPPEARASAVRGPGW